MHRGRLRQLLDSIRSLLEGSLFEFVRLNMTRGQVLETRWAAYFQIKKALQGAAPEALLLDEAELQGKFQAALVQQKYDIPGKT